MNAKKLAEDLSLKKGDFFTVVEWTSHKDNSYKGDCLEAVVVDHPFVRVRNHSSRFVPKMTLNLDQIVIQPLSEDFVSDVKQENAMRKQLITDTKTPE